MVAGFQLGCSGDTDERGVRQGWGAVLGGAYSAAFFPQSRVLTCRCLVPRGRERSQDRGLPFKSLTSSVPCTWAC